MSVVSTGGAGAFAEQGVLDNIYLTSFVRGPKVGKAQERLIECAVPKSCASNWWCGGFRLLSGCTSLLLLVSAFISTTQLKPSGRLLGALPLLHSPAGLQILCQRASSQTCVHGRLLRHAGCNPVS